MRICAIQKDTYDINKKVWFDHLEKNEKTWEVDTVIFKKFSPLWQNLRPGEYIYIYISEYKTIPVYGIRDGNKIIWHKIDYPRTSKEIDNFSKKIIGNFFEKSLGKWYFSYRNKENNDVERMKCEMIKEFLNNELKKEIIAELKKQIEDTTANDTADEKDTTANDIIDIIITNKDNPTVIKTLINARLGQGQYRNELLQLYNNKCPLTNITNRKLLIASHIQPWKDANNDERLDKYNGFILAVNYDKVFDKGYISFDDDGKIMISSKLTPNDISKLAINKNSKIKLHEENKKYLKYHRDNIFKK